MACPDPALAGSDPAVLHAAAGDTAVSGAADRPIGRRRLTPLSRRPQLPTCTGCPARCSTELGTLLR